MSDTTIPKGEQTRDHIVESALRLFATNGFEKTTMRAVAKESGLSLGAAYYYFRSKEELVLAYYQSTAEEAEKRNRELLDTSKDFKRRFKAIIEFKFKQLAKQRHLVKILARHGADFSHPLSPFSSESKPMRDNAIGLIEEAIDGSNLKVSKSLTPYLPSVLWLYQMGLILYWANDVSPKQKKTRELVDLSLAMLERLLKLSTLPLLGGVNKSVVRIITVVVEGLKR